MASAGESPKPRSNGAPESRSGSGSKPAGGAAGPLSGRKVGPYRITEQIGKGGMGVVYRAQDTALDRTVAIKILPGHLSGDDEFVKRFVREARACARLDHPNIVQVYQAGRMVLEGGAGPCFIAMQYFEGQPLSELIAAEGRLSPVRALDLARQVTEALGAAHAAGVVHRDIKSSNILVGPGDKVKVADFGLATSVSGETGRITRTGAYLGTPEYSSPEQCEGLAVDGRSDIYSLGVVLYEMLTGRVPFEAPTPLKLFERIVHEQPEPISRVLPGLPRELSALVSRMLAKDREGRPASAEELLAAIRRARVAVGTWKRGGGTAGRRAVSSRWGRSRSGLTAAAAAAALLAVAALGVYFHFRSGPRKVPPGPTPAVITPAPGPATTTEDIGVAVFDLDEPGRSSDPRASGHAWVRAGVPDMLITELKQCPGLAFYSRERVAAALKEAGDAGGAARKLGARLLVRGSVLAAGGRLRIDLRVEDVASGKVAEAVKDEGAEEQIFDLVNSLGRKLRASFDTLLAARRGQRLADAPVRRAEDCLFLAAAPTGFGGDAAGDLDGKLSSNAAEAAAARRAAGEPPAGAVVGAELTAEERMVLPARKTEADKQLGEPKASSGTSRPMAAAPAAPAAALAPQKPGLTLKDKEGALAWSLAPAGPAPAAKSPAEAERGSAGGEGRELADGRNVYKSGESKAPVNDAGRLRAGVTSARPASAETARRVEAVRRYYAGLALLETARTRDDFSQALAELALARSVAPDLAGLEAALKRAGAGLDAAKQ